MNDRFRFRAWHKDKKIMDEALVGFQFKLLNKSSFTGNYIPVFSKSEDFYTECGGGCFCPPVLEKIDNLIIMQCTGLKDKNGRLIFEGDILEFKHQGFTHRVEVDEERKYCTGAEIIEVIGNIYQHPELLEGKS